MFEKTLVHEFPIPYSLTEGRLLFSLCFGRSLACQNLAAAAAGAGAAGVAAGAAAATAAVYLR